MSTADYVLEASIESNHWLLSDFKILENITFIYKPDRMKYETFIVASV